MKSKNILLTLTAAACLAAVQSASAQTWVPTVGGGAAPGTNYNWNLDTNWSSPATFPNAIGATVTWSNIDGAQNVRLQQGITVGSLTFGDAVGASGAVTISSGTAGTQTLTLDNTAPNNAAIISQGSSNTISANVALADTVDVTTTSDLTISGAISGAGALNKAGNGTLTLSGANTNFSGGVNLSGSAASGGSRLNVGTATALGTGTLTISGGNLSTISGASNVTVTGLTSQVWRGNFSLLQAPGTLNMGTSAVSLGDGLSTGSERIITTNNNGTFIVNGVISDGGGVTKLIKTSGVSDAENVRLGGNNLFTGGLELRRGNLSINNAGALGTGTFSITGSSGTVTIDNTSGAAITNSRVNALLFGRDFTFAGTNNLNLGTGDVSFGAAGANRTITTTAGVLTLGGVISNGTGASALTKDGAGTLRLTGASNYTGATTISAGILELGDGTSGKDGTLTSASVVNNANLTYNRFGTASYGGAISGNGSVTKLGGGTQILSGGNSYAGATTVTAGRLLINGNQSTATGAISVGTGATLGGTGRSGGAVTVTGTLAPGASVESLVTGAVSFLNTSTFAVELDSSAPVGSRADLLVANGALSLAGTVNLTLTDLATSPTPFAEGTTFSLINYTGTGGTYTGGLFTVNGSMIVDEGTFMSGMNTWRLDYNALAGGTNFTADYVPNTAFVNIIAVPEPSTFVMVLGGFGMLLGFQRSRRRS